MSQKKNEGIRFATEIRVVGSYTDRLLSPHATETDGGCRNSIVKNLRGNL